jgi:pyrroloquinoline quinone (PQQ) biosynthesis protein C
LTECASVVSLNSLAHDRPGTTGRALPHVNIALENGEIIIRNPGFLGYVGEPHSGPFHTGDLGELDEKGFLSITGRKKNVLITSYGRNVSPEWVESVLLAQPEITQAFVYGDAQPYLSSLIVPSRVDADISRAIERANASLPDYAQIHHTTMTAPFTPQDGTLTGNGRLRRQNILETRIAKESTMSFYDRLTSETETARQSLYTMPQLTDALRGDISRDTYIAYLTEAYHHVRHTVRFLMAMGARLPEDKTWLHDAIAEYIEEEKGHEEWILNDIAAAGSDKEAARAATPNLETQVLVAYNYDYIARKNPMGFLGMVFMLESTSTQIAHHGADAVKAKLGLPQNAFTYLYSHGALDIEHLKFFEQLVNKIEDPADQAAIIEVAQNTFRLFANVMRAIPHEKALKNAA